MLNVLCHLPKQKYAPTHELFICENFQNISWKLTGKKNVWKIKFIFPLMTCKSSLVFCSISWAFVSFFLKNFFREKVIRHKWPASPPPPRLKMNFSIHFYFLNFCFFYFWAFDNFMRKFETYWRFDYSY